MSSEQEKSLLLMKFIALSALFMCSVCCFSYFSRVEMAVKYSYCFRVMSQGRGGPGSKMIFSLFFLSYIVYIP